MRPAVIGASVSSGFGLEREAKRSLDLSDVLEELLLVKTEEPLDVASQWVFMDPENTAKAKAGELLAEEPSVLFGLDFLFWFAYGTRTTEELHLARFERGLALLDQFPCPMVIGDLPDMRRALDAPVKMISAEQVPEPAVLARLNARLAAWAASGRACAWCRWPRLWTAWSRASASSCMGNVWEHAADRLLQVDHLHPTLEGTVGLALLALERARPRARGRDAGDDPLGTRGWRWADLAPERAPAAEATPPGKVR
jgi:hypothetical protein